MLTNDSKQDLRIRKTKKSLCDAMSVLLERNNFRKTTTKDICDEALISRATFYAHFIDKYDLFKYWLTNWQMKYIRKDAPYEVMEKSINQFVNQNQKMIKNILEDADQETLHILFDAILMYFNFDKGKDMNAKMNPKYIVFSNIFAGGIVYYLLWHVENRFPSEVMNTYLYDLIKKFSTWEKQ